MTQFLHPCPHVFVDCVLLCWKKASLSIRHYSYCLYHQCFLPCLYLWTMMPFPICLCSSEHFFEVIFFFLKFVLQSFVVQVCFGEKSLAISFVFAENIFGELLILGLQWFLCSLESTHCLTSDIHLKKKNLCVVCVCSACVCKLQVWVCGCGQAYYSVHVEA